MIPDGEEWRLHLFLFGHQAKPAAEETIKDRCFCLIIRMSEGHNRSHLYTDTRMKLLPGVSPTGSLIHFDCDVADGSFAG